MKRIESFDEYRALVDVVKMHDYRYFGLNNPTISDEEYDAMYFALQRDDYSSYTEDEEDEVRELLAEEGFISKSIDKIIDKMEANEWFSEEEEEE